MGKAKRAKLNRMEAEKQAAENAEKQAAEKRESRKFYLTVTALLLAAAIVVTGLVLGISAIRSSGNYMRNKISVTSDNYEVNNAMLSYYFRDNFYMMKSYYDYYKNYIGLDTSAPLKSQQYSDSMTWYDYFMNYTAETTADTLVLDEAAREAGIALDSTDELLIEREIGALKKDAEMLGMKFDKYLSKYYGRGLKESDVRDALELYYLSQRYYSMLVDGIEVSDAEVNARYESDPMSYMKVSYKAYTVQALYSSDATDSEKQLAFETAEAQAEELANSASVEEFDKKLMFYLTDLHKHDGTKGATTESIKKEVEATLIEGASYNEKQAYSRWLFDDETKIGDTNVFDDGKGNYSVFYVVGTKSREEYVTKNVRHILVSSGAYETDGECKAEAERILGLYTASGKTENDFISLVPENSTDTGSIYRGGLYKNLLKGQIGGELDEWAFDESRKAGDTAVVKTSYGYHVVYFVGDGNAAWYTDAANDITDEKYSELSGELVEKYKVTIDLDGMNVPDIN